MNYAAPISSGDMTLLTVAIPSALSAGALLGVFAPGASAATSNYLSIESGPNYSAVSTDSANWSIATGPAPVVGKPVVLCGTFKASGARLLYLDGVYQAQNATGRNPAGLTDVVEGCYNGGSGSGYLSPFAGSILLSLVFNRVLSAAEVAAISSNPWQIFKGRRNFLPAIATVHHRVVLHPHRRSREHVAADRHLKPRTQLLFIHRDCFHRTGRHRHHHRSTRSAPVRRCVQLPVCRHHHRHHRRGVNE
jgi:hypothetical protein